MSNSGSLKLFISYAHSDEDHINNFIKHLSPLKDNHLIKEWYDRKILAGNNFKDTIDNNLKDADIICLCISANFLSSSACMNEKDAAFSLRKSKGIPVIAIILSDCGWLDIKDLALSLALPTDGKPISSYPDRNVGWKAVYDGLKKVIESENNVRDITISDSFQEFLNDADLLTKAHSQKTKLVINDIYVSPNLIKYNEIGDVDKRIDASRLVDELIENPKILIAGENQSGKTTLCKQLFIKLKERKFIPIYVSDENNRHASSPITNRIKNSFISQYSCIPYDKLNHGRIIPIVDNFHYALKKDKLIEDLQPFAYQILIVDEIFSLNIKDESTAKDYTQYKIKEFTPAQRNELIKKWICLDDRFKPPCHDNKLYKSLDDATELVNSTLGKITSNGIMPSYPFFILSVLSIYGAFEKPLDQEITSQGYCYQALIYLYLRKQGVNNEDIDTYINFLSVMAYYLYSNKMYELTQTEYEIFMAKYLDKYNLPIDINIILNNLNSTKILYKDSCGNYYFYYSYLYYYFVAKYLAEHIDENKDNIQEIVGNLHNDSNAYITIFISHHTKSNYILDEVVLNSLCLFDKYAPSTLSKNELEFFDYEIDSIVKAVLPSNDVNPEAERERRLLQQEIIEENHDKVKRHQKEIMDKETSENELARELRRSIKTVEVMGRIVKNRSGSLERTRIEQILSEGMNVHLRILSSFYDIIKNKRQQDEIISYIAAKINLFIGEKKNLPSDEKMRKMAQNIFWNFNFAVIYGFINKIVHSLGSDKLQNIINKICDGNKTPATVIIKHGILMNHSKNLQIDAIANEMDNKEFSETAKRAIRRLIVDHCLLHKIEYKDKQKIENKLKIPARRLIVKYYNSPEK
jgi:hypothetical protein